MFSDVQQFHHKSDYLMNQKNKTKKKTVRYPSLIGAHELYTIYSKPKGNEELHLKQLNPTLYTIDFAYLLSLFWSHCWTPVSIKIFFLKMKKKERRSEHDPYVRTRICKICALSRLAR